MRRRKLAKMTRGAALRFLYENGGISVSEARPALMVFYRALPNLKPCVDDDLIGDLVYRQLSNLSHALGTLELVMLRGRDLGRDVSAPADQEVPGRRRSR